MRKTRRIRKSAVVATIAIIISLLILTVMSIYSISIALIGRSYTAQIANGYEVAEKCHPDVIEEYKAAVYENINPKRQELYDANAYNNWFFNELSSIQRAAVIVVLSILPLSALTIATWIVIDERRERRAHR